MRKCDVVLGSSAAGVIFAPLKKKLKCGFWTTFEATPVSFLDAKVSNGVDPKSLGKPSCRACCSHAMFQLEVKRKQNFRDLFLFSLIRESVTVVRNCSPQHEAVKGCAHGIVEIASSSRMRLFSQ